jgi:hypothetical protein
MKGSRISSLCFSFSFSFTVVLSLCSLPSSLFQHLRALHLLFLTAALSLFSLPSSFSPMPSAGWPRGSRPGTSLAAQLQPEASPTGPKKPFHASSRHCRHGSQGRRHRRWRSWFLSRCRQGRLPQERLPQQRLSGGRIAGCGWSPRCEGTIASLRTQGAVAIRLRNVLVLLWSRMSSEHSWDDPGKLSRTFFYRAGVKLVVFELHQGLEGSFSYPCQPLTGCKSSAGGGIGDDIKRFSNKPSIRKAVTKKPLHPVLSVQENMLACRW